VLVLVVTVAVGRSLKKEAEFLKAIFTKNEFTWHPIILLPVHYCGSRHN
jgi:hypothetical protein